MIAWLFLTMTVVATTGAQLSFKQYHLARDRRYLALALFLFAVAVPGTVLAARDLGIGRVYVATALTYVAASVCAWLIFRERLRRTQWLALSLIVAGVVTYNL